MRNRLLIWWTVLACLVLLPAAQADESWRVVRAVLLVRHGVRAPSQDSAKLAAFSARNWPAWPVAAGELTPHGFKGMVLLGQYLGSQYRSDGLLAAGGCQATGQILVWSDNLDQRTRLSGQALLDGMLPGCAAHARYAEPLTVPDPMFHPVQTRVCSLDEASVNQSVHGALARLSGRGINPDESSATLVRLGHLLHPEWSDARLRRWAASGLQVSTGHDGYQLKLLPPYGEAATVSEIFSLEYGQGLPADQVAWGEAGSADALAGWMILHNLKLAAVEQADYVAKRNGSMLAQRILTELQAPAAPDAHKLVILVGHDTNVANLAGMLGLQWHDSQQPDDIGPGTALVFEKLINRQGESMLRMRVIRQTADQLRFGQPLDNEHPPLVKDLTLPECEGQQDGMCRLSAFARLLKERIDPQCLGHLGGV